MPSISGLKYDHFSCQKVNLDLVSQMQMYVDKYANILNSQNGDRKIQQ